MKKLLLIFLFLANNIYSQEINTTNVLYGERGSYYSKIKNVDRIFIDKDGSFYPEENISNIDLIESDCSLFKYYSNHETLFLSICKTLGLSFKTFSKDNFEKFQNTLAQKITAKINSNLQNQSPIYFLIHGFRKPMKSIDGTSSSKEDYGHLRQAIQKFHGKKTSVKFVEIYWDGMYDCCVGKNLFKTISILKLFENKAQINAVQVGYSLRKIISNISSEKINIITHSLGARVALTTLFNTYDEDCSKIQQELKTPSQPNINICLIAPAISNESFSEYYERQTRCNFQKIDNYRLGIMFNENDFVLLKKWKKFGPGPNSFGNTSLGCNYKNSISELVELFKTKYENSKLITISSPIGISHKLEHYANSQYFKQWLKLKEGK